MAAKIFNSTITSGGNAQTIVAGSPKSWYIHNESAGDLRVTDNGDTPSSTVGMLIEPNTSMYEPSPTSGPLQIWGATTGQAFSGKVE